MIDLEALGFTKEQLFERVIERVTDQMLSEEGWDGEGESTTRATTLHRQLRELISKRVDTTINALAEQHVLPNVAQYIETLCLQETNKWGEKQGQSLTFIEYLVKRADHYMNEQVNHDGKSKGEGDSYNWRGTQTRVTHLIEKHLHFSIETAMKDALKNVTTTIAQGLHEACRLKINEAAASFKLSVGK